MQPKDDGKRQAQKTAFALFSQLKPRFNQRGIPDSAFWQFVKGSYQVESRAEISEPDWVRLAARLHTAKKHDHMLTALCGEIKGNIHERTEKAA